MSEISDAAGSAVGNSLASDSSAPREVARKRASYKTRIRFLVCTTGLFLVAGCTRQTSPPAPAADARPTVLRLGYTPSEETVADREEANRALARYLERTLGVTVTLVRTASYGPAIDAMTRGEIDLMSLAPFAYMLAAQRHAAEAIAATGTEQSGPRTYRSTIIAHRRTGLARLEEIVTRAKELRFNYTDPASNSGHLVPQARLAALGIDPERDFVATEFTLSHSVAIFNVAHGRVDVAGVSDSTLQRLIAKNRVRSDDFTVLWRSDPLPNGPIAIRPTLPAAFKREVQRVLIDLPVQDPVTARTVMTQFSEPNLVFLPCDNSLYDGLRRLAKSVENSERAPAAQVRSP